MNGKNRYGLMILVVAVWMAMCGASAKAQIYVAPGGSDSSDGSLATPYRTIQKAMTVVNPGGYIYLRGGVYANSATIRTNKNGVAGQYVHLWAYPGEKPELDFSSQIRGSSSRGLYIDDKFWYVKGLTIYGAGDNGIFISGDSNIVEGCTLFDNEDTGLQISNGGGDNLIRNCDSYANFDAATNGENADGFAPKLDVGPGNVFIGCRAWNNADDGWDMYEAAYPVILDSCWAFHNGYNIWNISNYQGDGNGFKTGGNFVPAQHIVKRCIAFDNVEKGFDQNNNTAGVTLYNCTAWRNDRNFVYSAAPSSGTHILKNNISFDAVVQIAANSVQSSNSWQGFTVTSADFVSLDTSLAKLPRNADYSLPETGFLRLASTSLLVNAGENVGLSYNGANPDLGAFEYLPPDGISGEGGIPEAFTLLQNFPNPFNPSTMITFSLPERSYVTLTLFDVLGRKVVVLVDGVRDAGMQTAEWNPAGLPGGVYYYRLTAIGNDMNVKFQETKSMLMVK